MVDIWIPKLKATWTGGKSGYFFFADLWVLNEMGKKLYSWWLTYYLSVHELLYTLLWIRLYICSCWSDLDCYFGTFFTRISSDYLSPRRHLSLILHIKCLYNTSVLHLLYAGQVISLYMYGPLMICCQTHIQRSSWWCLHSFITCYNSVSQPVFGLCPTSVPQRFWAPPCTA